jgi:hypothetical protein
MDVTARQLAYLRRLYRACRAQRGDCAESRAVARAISASEDERMELESALAHAGFLKLGSGPGTVALTDAGRRRALR